MNWISIAVASSYIFMLIGVLMLAIPLIDLLTNEPVTLPFLVSSVVLITLGFIVSREKLRKRVEPLNIMESIIMVSILWIVISIVSAIPLMFSLNISFIDAWFESVSGFTGTGFTVLINLDSMKPSIVTWRSIMQWTGELGVVVFAMILFPYFYRLGSRVYGIERPLKIEASFYQTARKLLLTYIVLTFIGIISCVYAGMNMYEAVNHTFTAIATGGMSTYDKGFQVVFERSPLTYIPIVILMIIGATNFVLLDRVIHGEFKPLWKTEEFRLFIILIVFLSSLTIVSYVFIERMDLGISILYGLFNQISSLTTTGFSLGSIHDLKPVTKFILIIGMFIGGMSFSTAGGIKVYRLLIILKKIRYIAVSSILISKYERAVKIDTGILDEHEVSYTLVYPLIHVLVVITGALIITIHGYDFLDSLFESISATSCVGLSTGIVSQTAPLLVKVVIIIQMLLGRLEFIQLFLITGYIAGFKLLRLLK